VAGQLAVEGALDECFSELLEQAVLAEQIIRLTQTLGNLHNE
jgi:hypothetical protein